MAAGVLKLQGSCQAACHRAAALACPLLIPPNLSTLQAFLSRLLLMLGSFVIMCLLL